jgi:flagellar basal body-associated protein FliL
MIIDKTINLFNEYNEIYSIMKKVILIAIGIGIVVAVALGVGLAVSVQSEQNEQVTPSQAPEGRHFEVELKESVGVKDNPSPP